MTYRSAISILVSALFVPALFSCKTTEANYRAAYEKTVESKVAEGEDKTDIFSANRRAMTKASVLTQDGTVEVRRGRVRLTAGTATSPELFKPFCVVAGQFKQLFNAKSLRDRLVEAGYPDTFVIETSEPYYYIVAQSFDNAATASEALRAIKAKAPVPMKEPLPFILEAVGRHAPAQHQK